jgi:hypothetical protein
LPQAKGPETAAQRRSRRLAAPVAGSVAAGQQ